MRAIIAIGLAGIALYAIPQATVDVDELTVYASSSAKSRVIGSLKRGQSVTVGMEVTGSDGSWCEITLPGPPPTIGYVRCEQLAREARPPQPNYSLFTGSSAADPAIAEALRLSGIEDSIAQLADPSLYLAAIQQKQLTPQQAAELRQIVMQAMQPERFRQAVMASVRNSYPADAYGQLLEILRSPLARRMSAIEIRESRTDPQVLQAFAAGMARQPPSAQRLALIRRIDQVTGSSELIMNTAVSVMDGLAAGSKSVSAQQSGKMIEEFRAQYGDRIRQTAFVKMLYTYRGVPDEQLSAYAALLAAPAAVRFNEAAQSGLLEATRQAAEECMRLLTQRFGAKAPPQ